MAKITFKNGSSIAFCGTGDPEAGRGLRPFEPHPSQKTEFAFSRHVLGYEFPDPDKLKNGASFKFVSVDISQGKSHSLTAELRNGKVFILDENVENTNLRDQEWIEAIVDDNIIDPEN